MTAPEQITEEDLQDYLDDRLKDRRRADVAAYLAKNPSKAAEIEALRLQDDALRGLGAEILEEPVPQRLTAVLRSAGAPSQQMPPHQMPHPAVHGQGHSFRLVEIAAALFIFVLGGAVGWGGHSQLQRGPSDVDVVLADASFAFATFASDEKELVDFGPDQDEELASFSQRVFSRSIGRPDLSDLGLNYRGARILPNARRLIGYFLFQNDSGVRVSITIWPSTLPPNRNVIASRMDDVQARFWLEENLGFAVMGQGDDSFLDKVTEEVFAYYQKPAGE